MPRHKTFVSYHHANDQHYKNIFEEMFYNNYDILISKSVQMGDINPNLSPENIRRIIRDEYLRDTSVTVVLIGRETWKRKHVDWEIGASLRSTKYNPRSGLIGILLPTHPDYGKNSYNPYICPPRLHFNVKIGFAKLYNWSTDPSTVQSWIHHAFKRRNKVIPDNSYPSFVNNRSGNRWY